MEKIKVNMSPNPLDVQTIHASQNDTEARQWEFELHNNGELIDTSDVKEQLVFKAYKGGTEQILPENTSTPTTSPFLGDIRYPQGILNDQEFTYRQSPTESDGLAKIADVKGNTIVWNQLINTVVSKTEDGITTSFDSSTGLFSIKNDSRTTNFSSGSNSNTLVAHANCVVGHKYLINTDKNIRGVTVHTGDQQATLPTVLTYNGTGGFYIRITWLYDFVSTHPIGDVTSFHIYIVDLTQMGLDITDPSEFTSLFPLSYYSYNQGSLLSFNGNGIKTVGKNRFNKDTITLNSRIAENGQIYSSSASDLTDYIDVGAFDSVNFSWDYSSLISSDSRAYVKFDMGKNVVGFVTYSPTSKSVSIDTSSCFYLRITLDKGMNDVQVENGQKTSYEPYTSSTLSLPISTYFPTGMKSAGDVYDELTQTKATTRVGAVDLGSLTWQLNGTRMQADIGTTFSNWNYNQECVKYTSNDAIAVSSPSIDKIMGVYRNRILIYDSSFADPTAFKTAMSGVYLYYELATPTETSFTTASLVTENAEIPLSNEDGTLIGKCTEQLSENPGFIDAKIKLSDADGECYSNKLQLHVERSPQ